MTKEELSAFNKGASTALNEAAKLLDDWAAAFQPVDPMKRSLVNLAIKIRLMEVRQ